MAAMTSRTMPTHSRKFSDCTKPPVKSRMTAMIATMTTRVFMVMISFVPRS